MAMHAPLLRLLSMLLLLLPSPLRDYLSASRHQPSDHGAGRAGQLEVRHPIILFPGFSCPNLEARLTDAYTPSLPRCGALKGKGWFPLSTNPWDLVEHDYVPCFEEQMSLVYDPVLDDYRNRPGVETRVPGFGSAYGFTSKNEGHEFCLIKLRKELETLGYRDGDTLFGAPYDLRHAPPLTGQPSEVYSDYFSRVKDLVQHASEKNGNKSVILVGHSFGGMVVQEFVISTTLLWRTNFIKHMVLISPTPPTGFMEVVTNLASGSTVVVLPTIPPIALRPMWRTFASSLLSLPSPWVFGQMPLIITKHRNYTAYDYLDFLAVLGFNNDRVVPFMKRVLPKMMRVDAPMVPTTYLNGISVPTPEQAVYWEGNFNVAPENVHGDGDGCINLVSVLAFAKELRRQHLESDIYFKFIKIMHATHSDIVIWDHSLKIVMAEIIKANW